jgi:hypothetical protein
MARNHSSLALVFISIAMFVDSRSALVFGQNSDEIIVRTERQQNHLIIHVRRPDDFQSLLMPAVFERFGKISPGLTRDGIEAVLGKPRGGSEDGDTYWMKTGQYIVAFDLKGIATSITMVLPDSLAKTTNMFHKQLLDLMSSQASGSRMTLQSDNNNSHETISCVMAGQTLRMLIWQREPTKQ